MRISTTPLILICAVFLLGFTSGAFAQNGAPGTPPKFQVTDLQHTCGPGTPTSGSITLTITDGDPAQGTLTVSAQVGINPPITQTIPIPPGFPATPIVTTLSGLSGNPAGGSRSYLVLVQDADNSSISDGGANYNIFNFQASLGSKADNTSANCATPNGSINVTLAGNTGVTERPIVFSWSGPAGFTDPGTKDLTGLAGGDYTLTYKDSNSPATSCTLGPIHINDPNPPDYNDLPNGTACGGDALGLDLNTLKKATSVTASNFELVSVVSTGLTAGTGVVTTAGTVMNATDLADDVWLNSDVTSHTVTYTLKTFHCTHQGNTITVTYTIAPQPVYNNIDNTSSPICSKTALGVTLDGAKVNLTADSYTVTNVVSTGLTAVSGVGGPTPYAATNTSLADDVWQNVNTSFRDVVYTIVPKLGGCSGNPFTVTVRITPQPNAPNTTQTVCSNVALNFNIQNHYATNGNNLPGTTFQWQAADNINVTGETLALQSTSSIADVLVNQSTSNQNVVYTVTPKTGTCTGNPFTVTVTVNAEPKATDGTTTICSKAAVGFNLQNHLNTNGNAIASSTFSWFADDNTNVTGESLAAQAGGTISDALVNTTSTTQQVVYHVTPKSPAGCVGTPFKVTVTVNPEPFSPPVTKTICSTDVVNVNLQTQGIDLGNAIANTTFSWIVLTDNPSVTGESLTAKTTQTINDALTNSSAVAQMVTYTVTPTSPAPSLCVGNTFTVTITVSPAPSAPNTTATTCSNVALNVDIANHYATNGNNIAGTTFQWLAADNINVTGETLSVQSTSSITDVLVNQSTSNQNVVYTVTPKNGTCVGNSFTITVTVNAEPKATDGTATICSKNAVGFNLQNHLNTNGNAIASSTFSWFADDNTNVTGESLAAQAGGTIGDALVNTTSTSQQVVYHVTPKSPAGCVGTPFKVTVTVNPEPFSPPITKTICSTDVVNVNLQTQGIDLGNAIANTTFSWIVLVDNPNVTGESLTAKTTQTINDALTSTSPVAQTVTYTVTPTSPAPALCVGNTFTVTITVSPKPVYVDYIDATGVCASAIGVDLDARKGVTSVLATAYDVLVIDHTGLTPAGGSPALALISDAPTGEIADDVWSNVTNSAKNVVYQITPKAGTCVGAPFTVTVAIKPQPDYADTPLTICSDVALNYDLDNAKNATSVVADLYDITNIVIPVNVSASAGNPQVKNGVTHTEIMDDVWKRIVAGSAQVVYTVVPRAGICAGAPFDITVTVNPEPVYGDKTLPDVCSQDIVNFDLENQKFATGESAATFTISANAGALTPASATTKLVDTGDNMVIADDQWRNVTNAPIPVVYTITPKTVDGCIGATFQVTVNVNPQPDYNNYNNTNVPGGICSVPLAIDVTTLRKSTSVIADTFTYTMPAPAGLTLVTDGGTSKDISDDVWSNGTSTNHDVTYHITPSIGTCLGDPFDVTVTILPTPDYNSYLNDNAPGGVCSRDAINVDITTLKKPASAAASSFTIAVNSNGMPQKAGAATTADISDDAWENTTTAALDVVYTITPKAGTCEGAPFTVTVTVNPQPLSGDLAKTICTGNNVSVDLQADGVTATGNGIASTFTWSALDNPNVSGETTVVTATGNITDVLVNNVTTDQLVTYTVTPKSTNGCVGDPFKVVVTVAVKPVLDVNPPADLCSGTAVNYAIQLTPAGQPVGTTFTWMAAMDYANITGESLTSQTGATISDVLVNTGTTAQTVDYTVTPVLGTCIGTSKTIQITVYPGLIANAGNDQTICNDATGYFLAGASVSSNVTSFTWFLETNPGDATLDPPMDINDPSSVQFHATMEGNYILRLETNTDPSGLCSKGVDKVTITVTKKPVITAGPPPQSKTICGNDLVAYEILMDQRDFNNATVFTWPAPNDPTSGAANAKPSPPGGVPMGLPGTIHINDELRNETNGNILVTYTVTAQAGICIGNTADIEITVKPSPVVAFGQTKTICSGEAVDYEILLAPANTPAGTKFSWPDPDAGGSATSRKDVDADPVGTLHILDTLYHYDPAGLPATVRYQIISQGVNGCYGRTRDLDIIVNSGAIANAGAPQAICSDGVLTLSTASVTGSATFNWTIISQPGTDGVITNGATADASTFKGTTPGVYKLQLTTGAPTGGACAAVSDVVVITVKPIGDPSCTGSGGGPCTTTATITVTDATCNNNDGSIKVENVTGGTAPYIYTLNGSIVNLPTDNTFKGLTADSYTLEITDATSCTKTFTTVISWPGFVAHYTPKITEPDCTANGANGSMRLVIADPGTFEFAFTADLVNEPLTYNKVGDSVIFVPNIAAGDYAVWMRPLGAGLKCTTKVFVSVGGVRAVTYSATATNVICFSEQTAISVIDIKGAPGLPFTYALTNTNDNSVRNGTISASQALATYSITGITKGRYSLLITQDQSSVTTCIAPISGSAIALEVDAPIAALDTLYVKRTMSVPDLPSGGALVGVSPSGREPYEVRLELIQPVFASQQFVMDWTDVPLNPQSLKFEYNFRNLYAGDYVLGLRDSLGCQKNYAFSLDVDTQLFIPNIFTPNEDGHNDVFYIRNLPSDAKVLITNRWGNEIYKSSAYQNDWGGANAVDGIYYYTVTVGKDKYTGWVEILRAQ